MTEDIPHKFDQYVDTLLFWNKNINLISETKEAIYSHHLQDGQDLAKLIHNKSATIADVGSGSGLPTILLAIMGYKNCIFVERSTKKCAFLQYTASHLDIKMQIINKDMRDITNIQPDYIVSRAVATIPEILSMTHSITGPKTEFLLFKSKKQYANELKEAQHMHCTLHNQSTPEKVIVHLKQQ